MIPSRTSNVRLSPGEIEIPPLETARRCAARADCGRKRSPNARMRASSCFLTGVPKKAGGQCHERGASASARSVFQIERSGKRFARSALLRAYASAGFGSDRKKRMVKTCVFASSRRKARGVNHPVVVARKIIPVGMLAFGVPPAACAPLHPWRTLPA